jgi:hypothetical protein
MADEDPGESRMTTTLHFRVGDRVPRTDASAPCLVPEFRPLVRGKIYRSVA